MYVKMIKKRYILRPLINNRFLSVIFQLYSQNLIVHKIGFDHDAPIFFLEKSPKSYKKIVAALDYK